MQRGKLDTGLPARYLPTGATFLPRGHLARPRRNAPEEADRHVIARHLTTCVPGTWRPPTSTSVAGRCANLAAWAGRRCWT